MKKLLEKNYLLYIPLIIIMIICLLNMQNAKLISPLYKYNLLKQTIFFIIGFIIIIIIKRLNISFLFKYAHIFYIINIILLILVLFIGKTTNGAKAWFNMGLFSFQPSELMKFTLSLLLAKLVYNYKYVNIYKEILFIIKLSLLTLIPSILVFLEPDTGAIIFFLIILFISLWIANINKKWFILLFSIILVFLLLFICLYIYNQDLLINLIGTSFFYRVERLITFHTNNSYQLDNALIAIGSSSFIKFGLNKPTIYIPEAPTDFILAFSIANFGYFNCFIIFLCYLVIDLYLIYIVNKMNFSYKKIMLISFIAMFIFGQIVNIGMNLGLLPIMGIPLPFLSYGGSTLIIYFIYLGIFQNKKAINMT